VRPHIGKFWYYRALSVESDISIIDLVSRLMMELAKSKSAVEGINAKVFISVHDNGFSPLAYWAHKATGISQFLLIQSGGRVELDLCQNAFIYADAYFGWMKERNEEFRGMVCKRRFATGPLRLHKFLRDKSKEGDRRLLDITFFEQLHIKSHPKYTTYLRVLENLIRFSNQYPSLKIAYCKRPSGGHARPENELSDQVDAMLNDSPIMLLSGGIESSYSALLDTRVVVALDSSIRCEALLLSKIVVSCSDRPEPHDFVVHRFANGYEVETNEYTEFSEVLIYAVSSATRSSCCQFDNLGENPVDKISREILKLVSESKDFAPVY